MSVRRLAIANQFPPVAYNMLQIIMFFFGYFFIHLKCGGGGAHCDRAVIKQITAAASDTET